MNTGVKAYAYTVTQVNRYIKQLLEKDALLRDVYVEAEISNFKAHGKGHLYFTLKDENAAIAAVMFRGNAEKLKFKPENGMRVTVFGYVSAYEKTGQYQLYVQLMEPAGKGALYLAYEQLKQRLEKAGVFDVRHKKPIPKYPGCVAVITSPTGAAVRDIIQISKRRNPSVELVIRPVLVQGENAAPDIVRAIREVNEWGAADTIIVGRGGGSIEDLWAFNEESVARAIFESKIPVISAVGHETDFTIADFISDMRAPTPSAAAELAIPEVKGFKDRIDTALSRMNLSAEKKLRESRLLYDRLASARMFKYPLEEINQNKTYVYDLYNRLERAMGAKTERMGLKLGALSDGLERLSPLAVLKKGYSIVYNEKNELVKDSTTLKTDDIISIKLYKGNATAKVID
jgi:exodeoxyribonuclease VII large subunit